MTTSQQQDHQEEADRIISSITNCIDRGVDPESGKRGECHIFIDNSNVCLCGSVDLNRERMR